MRQTAAGLSQHDAEQPDQLGHVFGEAILIFGTGRRLRQIERVQPMRRGAGQAHVLAADGGAQGAVLVLGVDDQEVDAGQQVAQRHELDEVALAGARHGEDGQVGVLQGRVEGVDDDRRLGARGDAVQHAPLHGEGGAGEREAGDERARVEVSVDEQVVAALGQAGAEAAFLFQDGHPRVGEHAVERALDAPRQVVERAQGRRPQQHVQTDREDALLAALQGVAQPLGVLEGDLALGIGQPPAALVDQSRRLQLDQLVPEQLHDCRRGQRVDVQADFDRLLEVEQRLQPAGADDARVADDSEHARVLVLELQVVAGDLDRGRRDQVDQGAASPREPSLDRAEGWRRRAVPAPG